VETVGVLPMLLSYPAVRPTVILIVSLLSVRVAAQNADTNAAAVRAVIEAQQTAWNRGDIDGFMAGYANEETTTFVSGDAIMRGWKTVLDRYRRTYDTREKMGTLSFTELDITPLGDHYIATGGWQLTRQGDMPRGRFTLIFRRTAAGWRIIHDHTSSGS
jgi:ketosteroid isomerase-like protein